MSVSCSSPLAAGAPESKEKVSGGGAKGSASVTPGAPKGFTPSEAVEPEDGLLAPSPSPLVSATLLGTSAASGLGATGIIPKGEKEGGDGAAAGAKSTGKFAPASGGAAASACAPCTHWLSLSGPGASGVLPGKGTGVPAAAGGVKNPPDPELGPELVGANVCGGPGPWTPSEVLPGVFAALAGGTKGMKLGEAPGGPPAGGAGKASDALPGLVPAAGFLTLTPVSTYLDLAPLLEVA